MAYHQVAASTFHPSNFTVGPSIIPSPLGKRRRRPPLRSPPPPSSPRNQPPRANANSAAIVSLLQPSTPLPTVTLVLLRLRVWLQVVPSPDNSQYVSPPPPHSACTGRRSHSGLTEQRPMPVLSPLSTQNSIPPGSLCSPLHSFPRSYDKKMLSFSEKSWKLLRIANTIKAPPIAPKTKSSSTKIYPNRRSTRSFFLCGGSSSQTGEQNKSKHATQTKHAHSSCRRGISHEVSTKSCFVPNPHLSLSLLLSLSPLLFQQARKTRHAQETHRHVSIFFAPHKRQQTARKQTSS